MAGDYASMRLMDTENGSLRAELFAKKSKPAKQRVGGAGARHMTSEETLAALAYIDWKASIALVHAEFLASDRVMARRTVCDDSAREVVDGLKRAEKAVVDAQKAVERETKKAEADAERARKKAVVDAERAEKKVAAAAVALENDENAHPGFAYTPDTPPALKRPRPNPKPAYRNANVAAGGAMQDPVLLAPIVPVLQVLTNYVPVIDPRLLADSYL
ncbi:hypothetical protein B0H16DRAFT_1558963 [Mycena metata]|uniref:Uncharacterized protein n=1 Tax=Mycena metata TaxID=1033252 RepID=A0AAD7N4C0_9AGAR|nr:hypothetical protein B0H16DRAFT_1558963 [Mycena metata]